MRILPCLLALCLAPAPPLAAWGRRGHEYVAAAALLDLPPDLGGWFQGQEDQLPAHASDPDHWKQNDPLERPRHHLDTEYYGDPGSVPRALAAAQALLGEEAFRAAGQLPWVIQQRVGTLAGAFLAGDRDRVVLESAYLSHYVGDLHVPLHTTRNHDGQETGQHGVHHRWETGLVDRLGDWSIRTQPVRVGASPGLAPWQWLQESFDQAAAVLESDRIANRAQADAEGLAQADTESLRRGSTFWKVFQEREEERVKVQLTRAAQNTAALILQAWTLAGQPPAP
jgi:hypothetical protein